VQANEIRDLIEKRQDELYKLLGSLVKINSEGTTVGGNEEECARYIQSLCNDLGLETDLFSPLELENFEKHPDYLPGRGLENRYNMVARWKGETDANELMLMAHTDTVVIGDLKNWEFEPLCGEIKDGKVFGRGACDDKYALATALFIIKLLKEQGFKPKANLLFAAYSDEECGGSHGALSAVLKYPSNRIVNMDGKAGQIWHCCSGGGEIKYVYHTKETVDSAKTTALAIPVVIDVLDAFAQKRYDELEANRFYSGTIIPGTSMRYMGIKAGDNAMDLNVGEVHFQFYTVRTKEEIYEELAELEKILKERLEPLGIIGDGFKPHTRFFHHVFCEPDTKEIKDMLEASIEATGKAPIVCGSCLSDLSVILKYGSKCAFGFGAGREFSQKGGAHQPNEFMECDKLLDYAKTIATYVVKVLG